MNADNDEILIRLLKLKRDGKNVDDLIEEHKYRKILQRIKRLKQALKSKISGEIIET